MRRAIALFVITACGAPAAPPALRNADPLDGVRLGRAEPLGWIALAPAPAADSVLASYLPIHATYPLVLPAGAVTAGTRVRVIGARGPVRSYTAADDAALPYGCDDNTLAVTPFVGARLPVGPAWILPPGAPGTWAPSAIEIRTVSRVAAHARFEVGPLVLALARSGPASGVLTVERAGRTLHRVPFERVAMEGAPAETRELDFAELDAPGIPSPIGAWSIAPGGPILVALVTPSWEGANVGALVVDDRGARAAEALGYYLYRCAF